MLYDCPSVGSYPSLTALISNLVLLGLFRGGGRGGGVVTAGDTSHNP